MPGDKYYGRNKARCDRYRAKSTQHRERKYKRVLKSCGKEFADRWLKEKLQKENKDRP